MKRVLLTLAVFVFLVAVVGATNWMAPPPTHQYHAERCTRYCHDVQCRHQTIDWPAPLRQSYRFAVITLRKGIGYQANNILLCVLLLPLYYAVMLFLLFKSPKQ